MICCLPVITCWFALNTKKWEIKHDFISYCLDITADMFDALSLNFLIKSLFQVSCQYPGTESSRNRKVAMGKHKQCLPKVRKYEEFSRICPWACPHYQVYSSLSWVMSLAKEITDFI